MNYLLIVKYIITENQFKVLHEIEPEAGHMIYDPLWSFYTYLDEMVPTKNKISLFKDFFKEKIGVKLKMGDNELKKFVKEYFRNPEDSNFPEKMTTPDSVAGFAYFVADKYFKLKKGVGVNYLEVEEDGDYIYYFFDSGLKIFVGRFYLAESSKIPNAFKVGMTATAEQLIGTGYGSRMYLTILNNVDYLISDKILFEGSYRMWRNVLPKYVHVWGVVDRNDDEEESEIKFVKIGTNKRQSVKKYSYFIGSAKYDTVRV